MTTTSSLLLEQAGQCIAAVNTANVTRSSKLEHTYARIFKCVRGERPPSLTLTEVRFTGGERLQRPLRQTTVARSRLSCLGHASSDTWRGGVRCHTAILAATCLRRYARGIGGEAEPLSVARVNVASGRRSCSRNSLRRAQVLLYIL